MQKIRPCLWFNDNAQQAVEFYLSVFGGEEIDRLYYNTAGPGPAGSVLSITFQIEEQQFIALNGGTDVAFNHAMSLLVSCVSQAEIDLLWDRLLVNGGRTLQCGWVQDQFGVCWQIVPTMLDKMLQDKQRAPAVMSALLTMNKLNVFQLEQAYKQAK
ncbi:VOC family protein [Methylophaga sp. SB9B]|uniref:VOC family protein n=1 Tax=Methylophaga sp. SB9B TaxID=2570356 RepID=UPI0010A83FF9|nr:VOC family protein [Methylophaga sp. SB9B]THK43229.1 VOC family protein [Methylophaga sp. SB9B]